jgi:hypothetical protein
MSISYRRKEKGRKKKKQIEYSLEVKAIGNQMKKTRWRRILFVIYKDSKYKKKEK